MIEELRNKAKELLKTKQVDVIIAYKRATDGVSAQPSLVTSENQVDELIWDATCVYNLSGYLKDFPAKKAGIVAKACDVKSIAVLLQENQLKRENLFIIGIECSGVINEGTVALMAKCKACKSAVPAMYDYLVKDKARKAPELSDKDEYEPVRKLEAKALAERLKFWQGEFSRCIRCYACRQVCPMCYCPTCVVDQAMPAWFSKAANLEANLSWNITRAMHLAGRCIDCGECERACPVGIPLRDINKKIEKDIKELFKYEAGMNIDVKPFLASFDKDDPGEFIK